MYSGAQIRDRRKAAGLTQAQAATAAGCSQGQWSLIERDAVALSDAFAAVIASTLMCTVDNLKGEPVPQPAACPTCGYVGPWHLEPSAIRAARVAVGASLADVARKIGVSKSAVSLWETGKSRCTGAHMAALVELFGLGVEK